MQVAAFMCVFIISAGTYKIVTEKVDGSLHFNVPYYYASSVQPAASAQSNTFYSSARSRRLAQEVATLSTSLPIEFGSTIFLRYDEERLDVMKVKSNILSVARIITVIFFS